jgi:nucleoid DNA-binding protein
VGYRTVHLANYGTDSKPVKGKALTKTAIYQELADSAGVTRKQVRAIFDELSDIIKRQQKKDGDSFVLAGLFRLRLLKKKAVKGGKTKPNPFKPGETIVTKDKPARNVIRVRPLKGLNSLVQ